jgi:osmotically-inducible protein OsmY
VDEQRREAHYRIERGTSCWLAGTCKESNAYRYDKALAAPVEAALKAVPGVERSSVWVTIQRRWVFLEGCVAAPGQITQLEQAARSVADVESVVPMLGLPGDKPRYPLADSTLTSPR